MENRTHISIKNLNVWYGENQVLNNINIDIPDKKITTILGPSGCGKTTLLKSLNRLIELQDGIKVKGEVLIDGEDILNPKTEVTHLRKKIGLLSQKPQVLPMSIYENVAYGPRIHGLKDNQNLDEIVEYNLNLAGLWNEVKDRLHNSAARLSIGQQQRLCLARGLAIEPEVILGDEPTSALDPISAERIEQKFLELKDKYTIIIVTHALRQAKRLADNVIFLYLGNLVEHGTKEEFFKNPKNLRTQNYINGKFVDEIVFHKELNLRGIVCPDNFAKTKLALDNLENNQVLKIIVDYEPAVINVPKAVECEGHKVLEIKNINQNEWEIYIEKQ